jgi:hypothetical protein
MNKHLSLEKINAISPYTVSYEEQNGMYHFTSDYGVSLAIDFMEDDLLSSAATFQLIVLNANEKKSPRDAKVQTSIMAIVTQFLDENQAAILYICETGDGKQKARGRLFRYWFDSYEYRLHFTCLNTSIVDIDGVENVATLIVKNDNPHLVELISEFAAMTNLLRNKPE